MIDIYFRRESKCSLYICETLSFRLLSTPLFDKPFLITSRVLNLQNYQIKGSGPMYDLMYASVPRRAERTQNSQRDRENFKSE